MMRALRGVRVLGLCLLAVACKGGSNITPVSLGVTPDFEPAATTPASGSVSLQTSSVSGEHIVLDVVVTDVSEPISGIAIALTFPKDIALFESCSDGDLLAAGTCYVSDAPLGAGTVFVGRAIENPQQPVPAVGSKTIVRLKFLVFGVDPSPGPDNVSFQAQNLGGGDSTALLDAAGDPIFVSWYGGMLTGH